MNPGRSEEGGGMSEQVNLHDDICLFWEWDSQMNIEELAPRVWRLRQALESRGAEDIYLALHGRTAAVHAFKKAAGGKRAVIQDFTFTLANRLADHERFFRRLGITRALQSGNQDALLLALAALQPFPTGRRKQMSAAMDSALERRDHKFFFALGKRLKRKPLVLRELDPKLLRIAKKYWATSYLTKSGQTIPPLSSLDDISRYEFLKRAAGQDKLNVPALREMLKRAGLSNPPYGKKQRRGTSVDPRILCEVQLES